MKKNNPIITEISIHDIKPAEYNPRIMRPVEKIQLKKSIQKFGLVDPIIIDLKHDNTVIGGHQRLDTLLELMLEKDEYDMKLTLIKKGDVGFVFNTENLQIEDLNKQKQMNLALNKIDGEFDKTKLTQLLDELPILELDVGAMGFNGEEMVELFEYADDDFFIDTEEDLENPDTPETFIQSDITHNKRKFELITGETWKIGNHTLQIGEINPEDNYNIQITVNNMEINFKILQNDLDNPDKKTIMDNFYKENKENKGLTL